MLLLLFCFYKHINLVNNGFLVSLLLNIVLNSEKLWNYQEVNPRFSCVTYSCIDNCFHPCERLRTVTFFVALVARLVFALQKRALTKCWRKTKIFLPIILFWKYEDFFVRKRTKPIAAALCASDKNKVLDSVATCLNCHFLLSANQCLILCSEVKK